MSGNLMPSPEEQKQLDEITQRFEANEAEEKAEQEAALAELRFDFYNPPPPAQVVYSLVGIPIATPGNLVAIASDVKTGKSAFIGAMIASTMSTDGNADLLGFSSENPRGFAVLHFDSEQSPPDHWEGIARILKRARVKKPPSWLYSYCLTGLSVIEAKEKVMRVIPIAAAKHGGIHSIFLDGIADFVTDVNDQKESGAFITELHSVAIKHHCPLSGVLHFNPNSDKTRGHLGSQFERKAETNLRLDKKNGVTVVWSEKQRRAPIPKKTGPCFAWSDSEKMHVTVPNPGSEKAESTQGRPATHHASDLLPLLAPTGLITKDWQEKANDELCIPKSTFLRLKKELETAGKVRKEKGSKVWLAA
jgi:hypothetical protein